MPGFWDRDFCGSRREFLQFGGPGPGGLQLAGLTQFMMSRWPGDVLIRQFTQGACSAGRTQHFLPRSAHGALRSAARTLGWQRTAQKWDCPHIQFVVVLFRNWRATRPRVPSPPIRGRRWPTGRMRGHSGTAACEKIPLTLPSPPNHLRRRCVVPMVAATQTIRGRGDNIGPSRRHKSRTNKISPNPTLFRSPTVAHAVRRKKRGLGHQTNAPVFVRLSLEISEHPVRVEQVSRM